MKNVFHATASFPPALQTLLIQRVISIKNFQLESRKFLAFSQDSVVPERFRKFPDAI